MGQDIDIEDVVMPFRTYAWAVTGSVSKADQLMMECFEGIAQVAPEDLPTTKTEWFDYIDNAIVDWVSGGEYLGGLLDQSKVAEAIKAIVDVQPDILLRLLSTSIDSQDVS